LLHIRNTSHAEIIIPTFQEHTFFDTYLGDQTAFSIFQVLIADDKVTGDPIRDQG
jgi:hypothetical protein